MAKPKRITSTTRVDEAVSHFYSEAQQLRDEIGEWKDNLENNNMSHMPKFDEVSETHDALESFVDEEPDVPEGVADLKLTITEYVPYGRKSPSRPQRMSNAVSHASVAVAALQTFIEGKDSNDEGISEIEELIERLEEHISEAEAVSFPGMY